MDNSIEIEGCDRSSVPRCAPLPEDLRRDHRGTTGPRNSILFLRKRVPFKQQAGTMLEDTVLDEKGRVFPRVTHVTATAGAKPLSNV